MERAWGRMGSRRTQHTSGSVPDAAAARQDPAVRMARRLLLDFPRGSTPNRGRPAARGHRAHLGREERVAARPVRDAAHRRRPCGCATCPRSATSARWAACSARPGRRGEVRGGRHRRGTRGELTSVEAPYELVKTMRASVLVLGPLLARDGARAGLAARRLRDRRAADQPPPAGAREDGRRASASSPATSRPTAERLRGAEIYFDTVTVTGTENVMMAAALADGETVIRNAACEPEIARPRRPAERDGRAHPGGGRLHASASKGVTALHGAEHTVVPDRIETGTFVAACAIAGGRHRDPRLPAAAPARRHREDARDGRAHRGGTGQSARALARARSGPAASAPCPTPASPPTCRRSTWRS